MRKFILPPVATSAQGHTCTTGCMCNNDKSVDHKDIAFDDNANQRNQDTGGIPDSLLDI